MMNENGVRYVVHDDDTVGQSNERSLVCLEKRFLRKLGGGGGVSICTCRNRCMYIDLP